MKSWCPFLPKRATTLSVDLDFADPCTTVVVRMDAMSSVLKKARINEANGDTVSSAMPASPTLWDEELDHSARLVLLRESMVKHNVSAYLVETQDAHQSEYVADHDKRREWLTGFTGSAGTALVTATKALMWTDGRYFLQVWLRVVVYVCCVLSPIIHWYVLLLLLLDIILPLTTILTVVFYTCLLGQERHHVLL